jgi:hypothetical protein
VRGSRLAEMIGTKRRSNPLNLMRVMPPKEARLGHAISAHGFFVVKDTNQENRNSGKEFCFIRIPFFLLS